MTKEEKDLLLKDLCARLPYGVKAEITWWCMGEGVGIDATLDPNHIEDLINDTEGEMEIRPYLRSMKDMTEEEEKQFQDVNLYELPYTIDGIDWLNAHHFDYRGLINDGLALEATDGIYENVSDLAIDNTTKITVGCKIRSKTNPDEILSIVSDDCHGDKFECSNGSVLSLKQIKKHYDIYIEENKGTIVIN